MENKIVKTTKDLDALIKKVKQAQKVYATFDQDMVNKIFKAAATAADKARIPLAKMAVEDTGMGVVEDKIIKNHFASEYIYNKYKNEKTCGIIKSDKTNGVKIVAEPLGVIAGVIPTTNPTSTAIFKSLISLKTRNAIILVVAIVGVAGFFGCKNLGVFDRMKSIETVGGEKYSAVEYEYYYKSVHNYFYQMSAQYDSYYGQGYGAVYTGYDTTKAPADQEYPYSDYTLEDGKKATWQQFFEHIALQNMQRNIILSDMAKEAGFEIDAAAQAEVDDQLQQLRDRIKEQCGATEAAVFRGTDVVGSFKGKVTASGAKVEDFKGPMDIMRFVKMTASKYGVSLRKDSERESDEWDSMEFYLKSNPGIM